MLSLESYKKSSQVSETCLGVSVGVFGLKKKKKELCLFSLHLCFKDSSAECAKELSFWVTATSGFHLCDQPSGNAYCCKSTKQYCFIEMCLCLKFSSS